MEPKIVTFGQTTTTYELDEYGREIKKEVVVGIPQCCREGWDSCTHVAQQLRIKRKNIGL